MPIYSVHAASGTLAIPGRPSIVAAHVLDDGPGGDSKSRSCEFSLDASLTSEPIFRGHPPDERLKFLGNRLSTTLSALI